jgi:plasmid stability protein
MTDLLIRNLDPQLKRKLQARARKHGRSLSDEAKELLERELGEAKQRRGFGTELVELFRPAATDLDASITDQPREPPKFE